MPQWLSRKENSNTCVYCGAEVPKNAEKCPKCGLGNGIKGTTTCDFCSSEIPSNAKICPKCHKEQVEAIIRERKSTGTYDADEEPIPRKRSMKESFIFCLKIVVVALLIALPFGFIGAGAALIIIGVIIVSVTAIVGGTYMPSRSLLPRRDKSESSPNPIWDIVGGVGLLLIFFGAIFYKLF
jgi:ribosomal protein L40E